MQLEDIEIFNNNKKEKRFYVDAPFAPSGDQPKAIDLLEERIKKVIKTLYCLGQQEQGNPQQQHGS